ncbi:hypothetical protein ASC77_11830 [Nocardioides sp. Root1257]|uniref:FAD:protein FMN transferase n=1 Tax=unclassified Nocardioides TaxID=2615069 RepID=UPI0006FEA320|nr:MULTISPECIES: FAD:protein FMN transferase [unclassified Nocardioides]KQW49358.1 hypothetical protein ASC77_11830 [Nocardioides sp. Root1257]KRC48532.1 hypothetical protein ASE24_11835 [Nocardioides sp. Root224]
MSTSTVWSDWSCRVRVTLATGSTDDLATARRVVQQLMAAVSESVSRFRDDSDLAEVNAAGGSLVPVRSLTVELTDIALAAARRTHGAVDPTVGAHLLAAGYDDDIEVVRRRVRTTTAARAGSDWRSVAVDRRLHRVGVPAGVRLDLGATAKAWTADEAARRVHARLGVATLVEIGGDLAVAGHLARPWRIDVAEVLGGPTYRVDLTHGGLATSSVLARSWVSDRGPEHHVIDPRTARPVTGDLRSATVWAPTAVEANTWSTAALVWGESAADRLSDVGIDARLVDRHGHVVTVGAWPEDTRAVA